MEPKGRAKLQGWRKEEEREVSSERFKVAVDEHTGQNVKDRASNMVL